MTFFTGLGIFILAIVVVFTPLFGLYYLIKFIFGFLFEQRLIGKIDMNYAEIVLSSKFDYYQKLDEYHKKKFLKRLNTFINNKEFIASGGHVLTEEMVVLISASAIQLTLGLDEYLLETFTKIFVYPKEFYSKIGKQYHKGETNLAGAIVLSWKHFAEGYDKLNDKYNLGLHEMAHALKFDKFKNEDYDKFFNEYYHKWQLVATEEYLNLKNEKPSFFRGYGGTNFHEFFAVCIEHFFESPAEFKKLHNDIYLHLCILLNQDPLKLYDPELRFQLIKQFSNNDFQLTGKPFYSSGTNGKHIGSVGVAFIIWLLVVISNFKNNGVTADAFIFVVCMLIVGYLIAVRAFSKVLFYENGVEIKYIFPPIFKHPRMISYDQMVCVEFFEKDSDELQDGIKITYIYGDKIRHKSYSDTFSSSEVITLADLIITKKVAVKLNSFVRYKK